MNKNFYFTLCLGLCLASCESNDDLIIEETPIMSTEVLNITYNGKEYLGVQTTYDENGEFVFMDEEFAAIYKQYLSEDNDWSIAMKGPHDIEFFNDLASNLKANGIEVNDMQQVADYSAIETRSGYDDNAKLTLYDDRDYKDNYKEFSLRDTTKYMPISNLKKAASFNDKCSSLIIVNNLPNSDSQYFNLGDYTYPCSNVDAVFIGYDDANFSDRTITCVAHAGSVAKFASLPGFNDKLSSFKFFFAQKYQYNTTI